MRPASTARLWAYGWWCGLVLAAVLVVGWNIQQIQRYNDVFDRPRVTVRTHVIAFDARNDLATVAWVDAFGVYARYTFETTDIAKFERDDEVWLAWDPDAPELILPFDDRGHGEGRYIAAALALILALLCFQVPWLVRFVGWWRAARGPARRYRAWLQPGRFSLVSAPVPWLRLEGDDGVWYQPVMWEPWLADRAMVRVEVSARRARRRGPMVVDVPGRGRLWPAGRPWRNPRRHLVKNPDSLYPVTGAARWRSAASTMAIVGFIVGIRIAVLPGVFLGAFMVSLYLFFSGPPSGTAPVKAVPVEAGSGTGADRS